uniref:Uncharacterized protein n=1 Tax=Cucumis melo TaxID=3656 RepID=A0A9I9E7C6_CUCME
MEASRFNHFAVYIMEASRFNHFAVYATILKLPTTTSSDLFPTIECHLNFSHVPYLIDPNTGIKTGDYKQILSHIFQTYSTATRCAAGCFSTIPSSGKVRAKPPRVK